MPGLTLLTIVFLCTHSVYTDVWSWKSNGGILINVNDPSNPNWRLEHFYKIVDKQGERVTFKPNIVQKIINKSKSKRKMILKARQFGVSTNELLKLFDRTIWTPNSTQLILAHESDAIKKLFRIITRAYKFLDDEIKPNIDRGQGSKYEHYYPDINSRIYCDLETRGDTIHRLHVSEAAFIKDMQRLIATLQAVPLNGEVTLESTPNGMNDFYDRWMHDDTFEKLFFPWFIFPEYHLPVPHGAKFKLSNEEKALCKDAKKYHNIEISNEQIMFRRLKIQELKHLFFQEYPESDSDCFLASGSAAMNLQKVKELLDNSPDPIKETDILKIYKKHDKSKHYVIGCDTAEGVAGDYSVATVIEVESRQQVAVLRGHLKPSDFAHEVNSLAYMYSGTGRPSPLLAVERNNHGHAVLLELEEHINYSNLYKHKDKKLGWLTDRVTRPIMIDTFIDGVENQTFQLNCKETLGECLTLIVNNGKIEAESGRHDDCVIAAAIALQMCIEVGSIDRYDNIEKRILL